MKKINSLTKRFLAVVFAVLMCVSAVNVPAYAAEKPYEGLGKVSKETLVYDDPQCTVYTGNKKVFAYETFTLLTENSLNIIKSGYDTYSYKIEYSTPNGPKTGYINPEIGTMRKYYGTTNATITSQNTVYYGSNPSKYQASGTVYANERVVVISECDGWAYIEYNTSAGRKRGFIDPRFLGSHNKSYERNWPLIRNGEGAWQIMNGTFTIYSGNSTQYTVVEKINNKGVYIHQMQKQLDSKVVSIFVTYDDPNSSQRKSGWIVYVDSTQELTP